MTNFQPGDRVRYCLDLDTGLVVTATVADPPKMPAGELRICLPDGHKPRIICVDPYQVAPIPGGTGEFQEAAPAEATPPDYARELDRIATALELPPDHDIRDMIRRQTIALEKIADKFDQAAGWRQVVNVLSEALSK